MRGWRYVVTCMICSKASRETLKVWILVCACLRDVTLWCSYAEDAPECTENSSQSNCRVQTLSTRIAGFFSQIRRYQAKLRSIYSWPNNHLTNVLAIQTVVEGSLHIIERKCIIICDSTRASFFTNKALRASQ